MKPSSFFRLPRFRFAGVALGLAIGCASAVGATFDFAYTMSVPGGVQVTGSLSGTQDGNFVTGVTVDSLFINGIATGPVGAWGFYGNAGPTVSFNSADNDFWFADPNWQTNNPFNGAYGFALLGGSAATNFGPLGSFEWVKDTANGIPESIYPGTPLNTSWSLVESVPDNGTAVALLGFSFLGLVGLRRRFAR